MSLHKDEMAPKVHCADMKPREAILLDLSLYQLLSCFSIPPEFSEYSKMRVWLLHVGERGPPQSLYSSTREVGNFS